MEMQTKNTALAATTVRAIEGKYFMRYLVVLILALVGMFIIYQQNRAS